MDSQMHGSETVNPAVPFVSCIEQAPTLSDLFKTKPIETLPAAATLFWEGDQAGHIFDVLEE